MKKETAAVKPHVWKGVARTLMTEDQRPFLRTIRQPTLILWGENDQAFPAAHQQRLQEALPHATFKRYPEVGHNPHWEIPGRVAGDILGFLEYGSRSFQSARARPRRAATVFLRSPLGTRG